jgi:NADPH2:quinone reductase
VNPLDQKFRDFNVFNIGAKLPAVLGNDVVGTVVKNGPNVSAFPIGSRVFAQSATLFFGGLQEYMLIDARYAALVPEGVSDEDAAVFPINAFTSAVSLFSNAGFGIPFPGTEESKTYDYKSQKLVIIGGGTNCGKLAIQLARIAGIGTIITTASLSSEAELKAHGATHVIDRTASTIEKQVRSIVGDDLLYVYDTFHRDNHDLGVSLLSNSRKGTFIHLLPGKASDTVIAQKQAGYDERQTVGACPAHPAFAELFWKQFPKWLQSGAVKPLKYNVIEGLDAQKVNEALDGYKDLSKGQRYHVRL